MLKQEVQRRCVEDPLYFAKACLPKLFETDSPEFHRSIIRAMVDPNVKQLNVLAPRGHAKSTLCALLFPLWRIFCEDLHNKKKPSPKFVLLVSKSRSHTVNLLTTIKNQLEYNEHLKAVFGYQGAANAKAWREDIIRLANGSMIVCRGMGQQVRGLNIDGMRPDYIILDDAEDEENTKTVERMEDNLRWILQGLVPAGSRDCKVVNIGTPQKERSIVFTLKQMPDWKTMSFKAINRDADGNDYALWPEMRSLEWLYEKKESLESIGRVSAFYREYQCEVIGDSDQLFRETDLQYYEGDLSDGYIIHSSTERKTPVNVFMGVDPASSVRATADYTCIMVIGMDADKNVYVIDYLRKRIKPMDVADSILSWYNKYKPMKVQIETVGYQEMLRDYLTRLEGVYIPGLAIKNQPRKGKVQRLEGMQPMFARKKVYVKKGHSEFIDEVLIFPRGKHDDTLDAFFYAVKGAFPPYEEEGYRNNEDMPNVRRVSYDWMVE